MVEYLSLTAGREVDPVGLFPAQLRDPMSHGCGHSHPQAQQLRVQPQATAQFFQLAKRQTAVLHQWTM